MILTPFLVALSFFHPFDFAGCGATPVFAIPVHFLWIEETVGVLAVRIFDEHWHAFFVFGEQIATDAAAVDLLASQPVRGEKAETGGQAARESAQE